MLISVLVKSCFRFVARLCTIMNLYVQRSFSSGEEERMCLFLFTIFARGGFPGLYMAVKGIIRLV